MKIRVYTDGACSGNPGPGGWAMVFNKAEGCETYSGRDTSTTNNRMELTAVLKCLSEIRRIRRRDKSSQFEVYSDSAYVVNALNNGWLPRWKMIGWKTKTGSDIKNRDLWEQVYVQCSRLTADGCDVKFIKVRGHAGNTFNELVDRLAKQESMQAQAELVRGGV